MTTLFSRKRHIIDTIVSPVLRAAEESLTWVDVPNLAPHVKHAKVMHLPENEPERQYWVTYHTDKDFGVWGYAGEIAEMIAMHLISAE